MFKERHHWLIGSTNVISHADMLVFVSLLSRVVTVGLRFPTDIVLKITFLLISFHGTL